MKTDWQTRLTQSFQAVNAPALHFYAYQFPKPGFESALVGILNGLAEYAQAHAADYESAIGNDGFLGDEHWLPALRGLWGLLNGERGRLDGGAMSRAISDLAEQSGYSRDLEEL